MGKQPKNGPVVGWCPGFKCHRKVRAAFVDAEGRHTAQISAAYGAYRGPCLARVLKIGSEAIECDGKCGAFVLASAPLEAGLRIGRDSPGCIENLDPRLRTPTGWKCLLCQPPEVYKEFYRESEEHRKRAHHREPRPSCYVCRAEEKGRRAAQAALGGPQEAPS